VDLGVGGSPTAGYFILLAQNKVTKQKGTLRAGPAGCLRFDGQIGRLRNSPWQLAQNASCCGAQTVLAFIPI
jgi:hypothetical protein